MLEDDFKVLKTVAERHGKDSDAVVALHIEDSMGLLVSLHEAFTDADRKRYEVLVNEIYIYLDGEPLWK